MPLRRRENGDTAPRILDLGTRWRWVVSFTLQSFYPRKNNPWYPLERRLGGIQRRYGRGGEEKKSLLMPGIEPRSSVYIYHPPNTMVQGLLP